MIMRLGVWPAPAHCVFTWLVVLFRGVLLRRVVLVERVALPHRRTALPERRTVLPERLATLADRTALAVRPAGLMRKGHTGDHPDEPCCLAPLGDTSLHFVADDTSPHLVGDTDPVYREGEMSQREPGSDGRHVLFPDSA